MQSPYELREHALSQLQAGPRGWLEGGVLKGSTRYLNATDLESTAIVPNVQDLPLYEKNVTSDLLRGALIVCPMGHLTQFHADGELGVARASHELGIAYSISAMSRYDPSRLKPYFSDSVSLQIYPLGIDHVLAEIEAAKKLGIQTIVITVDGPSVGLNYNKHGKYDARKVGAYHTKRITRNSQRGDCRVGINDYLRIRDAFDGTLVVKGIMSTLDAKRFLSFGYDKLWISNHGGRVFESNVSSATALKTIRSNFVTDCELVVDGGVLTGMDVLRYIGLGADKVGIGRLIIYGLIIGGYAGVRDILGNLLNELDLCFRQSGHTNIETLRMNTYIKKRD